MRAEEAKAILVHEYLESVAAKVQDKGITARVITFEGRPHFQVLQYAKTIHVDMMAMCSGGQSGLSRWMIGGGDRVMVGANMPMLLVQAQEKEN